MLCKDAAADFLESLPATVKTVYQQLKDELIRRFSLPATLHWKRAAELWRRTQGSSEPVEAYMAAILNLAREAGVTEDSQVKAAVIQGLRPTLQQAVLQRPMTSLQEVMESARIAEAVHAATQTPDEAVGALKTQLDELTSLVRGLVTTTSTPAVRAITPPRRVSFEERHRSPSPSPDRRRADDRRRTSQWNDSRRRNTQPRHRDDEQDDRRNSGDSTSKPDNGPNAVETTNDRCGQCGLHHTTGTCNAYGQQCFRCGKRGHFARCCRTPNVSSRP